MNLMQKHLSFAQEILGMDFSLANQKLHKLYLFKLIKECNLDMCYRCNQKIENVDELSIEHINRWMGTQDRELSVDNFLDFSNIRFSHLLCNCAASNAGTGKSKYIGVSWYEDKKRNYSNWRAVIKANDKLKTVKLTKNEEEAAEYYDMALLFYREGKGMLNFPEKIDIYKQRIENGIFNPKEKLKCKICGGKHSGNGYCRKHYYEFCGGREKRKQRYLNGKR